MAFKMKSTHRPYRHVFSWYRAIFKGVHLELDHGIPDLPDDNLLTSALNLIHLRPWFQHINLSLPKPELFSLVFGGWISEFHPQNCSSLLADLKKERTAQ